MYVNHACDVHRISSAKPQEHLGLSQILAKMDTENVPHVIAACCVLHNIYVKCMVIASMKLGCKKFMFWANQMTRVHICLEELEVTCVLF